jgi:hypothetical protein
MILGAETPGYWRAMFGFPIICCLLQLFLLIKVYPFESPRWLWANDYREEATEDLYFLYRPWVVPEVLKQLEIDYNAN